jgi:hypothetical protein
MVSYLTEEERQLLVLLVTKQWVEIRDLPGMEEQTKELEKIMIKIGGAGTFICVRE